MDNIGVPEDPFKMDKISKQKIQNCETFDRRLDVDMTNMKYISLINRVAKYGLIFGTLYRTFF